MTLNEAISLIRNKRTAVEAPGHWADLGCGSGLFTYALANLLPAGSDIIAIDKEAVKLQPLPNPHHIDIQFQQADMAEASLHLSGLNGVLMANACHYISRQTSFLGNIHRCLVPGAQLLLVEYDTGIANQWVPYPLPFSSLVTLCRETGFQDPVRLGSMPSRYNKANLYAAIATRQ